MTRLALATLLACTATIATAAPAPAPSLSAARSGETLAMFEKLINTPTVIGRGQVPDMANYLAEQYRAHGKDERLPEASLNENVVHWTMMLRDLAGK